jgi:hypothetical protein
VSSVRRRVGSGIVTENVSDLWQKEVGSGIVTEVVSELWQKEGWEWDMY